eukprot:5696324-Ditylum_brightwellii.AAC.1
MLVVEYQPFFKGNSPTQKISGKNESPWNMPQHIQISGVVINPLAWWRVSRVRQMGMVAAMKLIITGEIL